MRGTATSTETRSRSNGADDFAGFQRLLKNHGPAHQLRQKHSQKLSEDMAQRQQVQKAHRMHQAFVLEISLNFRFERRDIAENIAVGNYHAFGFGGRSRK